MKRIALALTVSMGVAGLVGLSPVDRALAVDTGAISGTVTADGGDPLEDICVDAYGDDYTAHTARTAADGTYDIRGLRTGNYIVEFSACVTGNYRTEYYNNVLDVGAADPVAVTAPNTTAGIDAALTPLGFITGTVTADGSGDPLEHICVWVVSRGDFDDAHTLTAADGTYRIWGLRTGYYNVYFQDIPKNCGGTGAYVSEAYDNAHYPHETPVAVTAPNTTAGIDAALTAKDGTYPTVDLRTPPDGAVYAWNQVVAADYSCVDGSGGSGIASCVGYQFVGGENLYVADGAAIDTSIVGGMDLIVTATDNDDRDRQVLHRYTVLPPQPPRPDGSIKVGAGGAYVGDNIYNTTGAAQTANGSAARGRTVTYFVSAQNDGPTAERLRLRGGASNSAFTIAYKSPTGVNITSRVTAGTYTTPVLAPGATHVIKVVVTVKNNAPPGASLGRNLTATSTTNTTRKDTVRFVTTRT